MDINERFKYKRVRSEILRALKQDLIGPSHTEADIIYESPMSAYLTGILHPLDKDEIVEMVESDTSDFGSSVQKENRSSEYGKEEELEEPEAKMVNKSIKKQSSMGIRFYMKKNSSFQLVVRWGEYDISTKRDSQTDREVRVWTRRPVSSTSFKCTIDLSTCASTHLTVADNVVIQVIEKPIEGTTNCIVAVFLRNLRKEKDRALYQVEMELSSLENNSLFLSENFARHSSDSSRFDEFLYRNKPVFAKGFGCAADWSQEGNGHANILKTTFIPEQEIASMSTELPTTTESKKLKKEQLSIKQLSEVKDSGELIKRLSAIPELYAEWILDLGKQIKELEDKEKANVNIRECEKCLKRIEDGIQLLKRPEVFEAFIFMNQVMHMQNAMRAFAKEKTSLETELTKEYFSWRPFQLAFILMNIEGLIKPYSEDRKIVDLLWFPTGGGKTEAYLGIAAFLLAYRRLIHDPNDDYNRDGGVTIFLRYTLRLLTTQQRDRLMRMICAAEILRNQTKKFGESEFSVGFWVGGQVTVNKLTDLTFKEGGAKLQEIRQRHTNLKKQVIECPCCGYRDLNHKLLPDDNLYTPKTGYEIFCNNPNCYFSTKLIPVYMIDEDIYRKLPSVIISTVDKFARMPWDEIVSNLFGKVNRLCEKCGYIGAGEEHQAKHTKPLKKVEAIKPFYPPELIIQDELHLITGPLGTIYGAYETAIESLCSLSSESGIIQPKYIASTATIKNAEDQILKIYGREKVQQFPPPGLSIENSFFAQEIPIEKDPFRLYAGICVSGQSVKTVLLRIYAVLLQFTETHKGNPDFSPYLDPYRTLVGYYNSIRELGGAVRLLADDIPKRIRIIVEKYKLENERYINYNEIEELTSRVSSYKIPAILAKLENKIGEKELTAVLATNMIAVGMDVDRLGLMVVTGQPKQTAEYIQASSRIGRKYPGLAITVYNPYRPRDLSHYQNFKAYHSRLYQYVEGTTATPFASRARDKTLHAIAVSLLRLRETEVSTNDKAKNIKKIDLSELKEIIKNRVTKVENKNVEFVRKELEDFLDYWNRQSETSSKIVYWKSMKNLGSATRLLRRFSDKNFNSNEKMTMDSMRSIEQTAGLYIQDEWWEKVNGKN
ncbi:MULTISPECIES: DISARM system helicase DrmA [Saccharibacillus]|uniref:DISARM system helicase DrmA n=1 Tax=Saccharibacillus TaxID=456492 RepID=UPI00123852C7|nr:DISARM system helicase DrmA [Saccharibacillus sp. WB 17]MWJ30920.1 DNA helicase [Saccharibacillus sp. WB 17]